MNGFLFNPFSKPVLSSALNSGRGRGWGRNLTFFNTLMCAPKAGRHTGLPLQTTQSVYTGRMLRPVSASIMSRRLYLANRSDCVIEPTLM